MSESKKKTTIILGISLAIAGIHHGFFEILQGNNPTNGTFIESIGPEHRMWVHGNDPAMTLIPNFLFTGITAILIGLAIIFWVIFYIDKKYGPSVFLLLFMFLTLSGGGIGYIPFFILIWIYAKRKNESDWIKQLFPGRSENFLSNLWIIVTWVTAGFFIIGLEISVFGYFPGVSDPDLMLTICWSFLLAALVLINFAYLSAAAIKQP